MTMLSRRKFIRTATITGLPAITGCSTEGYESTGNTGAENTDSRVVPDDISCSEASSALLSFVPLAASIYVESESKADSIKNFINKNSGPGEVVIIDLDDSDLLAVEIRINNEVEAGELKKVIGSEYSYDHLRTGLTMPTVEKIANNLEGKISSADGSESNTPNVKIVKPNPPKPIKIMVRTGNSDHQPSLESLVNLTIGFEYIEDYSGYEEVGEDVPPLVNESYIESLEVIGTTDKGQIAWEITLTEAGKQHYVNVLESMDELDNPGNHTIAHRLQGELMYVSQIGEDFAASIKNDNWDGTVRFYFTSMDEMYSPITDITGTDLDISTKLYYNQC